MDRQGLTARAKRATQVRNAAHVNRFSVFRALKSGIRGRDEIARATGVPSQVVTRILNSRAWATTQPSDLTEELV